MVKGTTIFFKILVTVVCILSIQSCTKVFIRWYIKNPRVETTESIKHFLNKNKFSTNNVVISMGDTSTAYQKLQFSFTEGETFFFNKSGQLLKYKGSETCGGKLLTNFLTNEGNGNYEVVKDSRWNLNTLLAKSYDLNNIAFDTLNLPKPDYYIVSIWQIFMGGKRGYEDKVNFIDDEIKKLTIMDKQFIHYKLNYDLQENWGFKAGKKVKRKLKIRGSKEDIQMDLSFGKLPIKK